MSKAMKFQVLVDKTNAAASNLKPTAANTKKAPVLASLQNRGISAKDSVLKKYQDVKPRVVTRFTKPIVEDGKKIKTTTTTTETAIISDRQPLQSNNGPTKAKGKQDQENVVAIVPNAKILTKTTTTTAPVAKTAVIKNATVNKNSVIIKPSVITTKTTTTSTTKTAVAKAVAAIENKKKLQQQQQQPVKIINKNVAKLTHSTKLLENVENIDKNDEKKFILVTQYVNDIYEYLFQLEGQQLIRAHFLDSQTEVTPRMRAVLMNWINEVHEQYHLAVETYHMTIAIVDRYLQLVNDTKRCDFQLVGVTAIFIAAKYEELFPPSVADLAYITDDSCSAKEILQMELQILKVLDCDLSRPLPIHFLRRFSKAAKAEACHHTAAKYFLELVSLEYELAHYRPSKLAAASLLLALHLFNEDSEISQASEDKLGFNADLWNPTLTHYSTYTAQQLQNVVSKIALIVQNAPQAKLSVVYHKYEGPKYQKISQCAEMSGPVLASLINN